MTRFFSMAVSFVLTTCERLNFTDMSVCPNYAFFCTSIVHLFFLTICAALSNVSQDNRALVRTDLKNTVNGNEMCTVFVIDF